MNPFNEIMHITIAISNMCNFHCAYCFERKELNHTKQVVTDEVRVKFITLLHDYIIVNLKHINGLEITYFGGEPLLEYKYILDLNTMLLELSKKNHISFQSDMITNGYLLTRVRSKKLISQNCSRYQITIDGNKTLHNKRRSPSPQVDSYTVILENAFNVCHNGGTCIIRINIDKTNQFELSSLIDDLIRFKNEYSNAKLFVEIRKIEGTSDSFADEEFQDLYYSILPRLIETNLFVLKLPSGSFSPYCNAEYISNNISVDIFENIYQCWEHMFEEMNKISTLDEFIHKIKKDEIFTIKLKQQYGEDINFLELTNNQYNQCIDCKYLAICKRGCPRNRMEKISTTCNDLMQNKIKNEILLWEKYQI